MPKISVIIPTYNSAEWLTQAVDSVLSQTCHDFEIIVIDDGSQDNTPEVIQCYGSKVRWLTQSNRGPATARNAGIKIAQGQYLVFLDADDVLLPDKLALQAAFLDQHPEVDIVYSNGYRFRTLTNGKEELALFSKSGFLKKSLSSPEKSLPILAIQCAFPLHAAMARRRAIIDVKGFDDELAALEDWDIWFRLAHQHRFAYFDAVVVKYRVVHTGISEDRSRQILARTQLMRKIESSPGFLTLSQQVQSDFYFCWGVFNLECRNPQTALLQFRQALRRWPQNLLARSALIATLLFGSRAVVFYHLKWRVFGAR